GAEICGVQGDPRCGRAGPHGFVDRRLRLFCLRRRDRGRDVARGLRAMTEITPADAAIQIMQQAESVELPEGMAPDDGAGDPPPADLPPLDSYADDYPGGDAPPAPP